MVASLGAPPVYGQLADADSVVNPKAFSRIDISAGGAYNVGDSEIHDFWEPGYGADISVTTPFYLGAAEAGAAYHRYDVTTADVPRFDALLVFVGWGLAFDPVPAATWYNGFRIGNNRMSFDEETFPGIRNESEFLLGAQSKLSLRVFGQTGIFAAAHFTQTYTFIRYRTIYVSAGLTTSFSSPSWLQTILR